MLINSLMFIFGLLLIICGIYLYRHQHKNFIFFRPETDANQAQFFKVFGIIFIIAGMIAIFSILFHNAIVFSTILFLVCMLILLFNIIAGHFLTKRY